MGFGRFFFKLIETYNSEQKKLALWYKLACSFLDGLQSSLLVRDFFHLHNKINSNRLWRLINARTKTNEPTLAQTMELGLYACQGAGAWGEQDGHKFDVSTVTSIMAKKKKKGQALAQSCGTQSI